MMSCGITLLLLHLSTHRSHNPKPAGGSRAGAEGAARKSDTHKGPSNDGPLFELDGKLSRAREMISTTERPEKHKR
jgi:hypothetical protein